MGKPFATVIDMRPDSVPWRSAGGHAAGEGLVDLLDDAGRLEEPSRPCR